MGKWNSIIVPFDKTKNIARKVLIDHRGEPLDLCTGLVQLKNVICVLKKDFDSVAVLVSNMKTHYEIDSLSRVIKEYSPLEVFPFKASKGDKKVIAIENPVLINFCELSEFQFQLMDLDKKKISDIEISVHMYYQFC